MASPSNRSEYSPKEKAPPTLTPTSIKHQSGGTEDGSSPHVPQSLRGGILDSGRARRSRYPPTLPVADDSQSSRKEKAGSPVHDFFGDIGGKRGEGKGKGRVKSFGAAFLSKCNFGQIMSLAEVDKRGLTKFQKLDIIVPPLKYESRVKVEEEERAQKLLDSIQDPYKIITLRGRQSLRESKTLDNSKGGKKSKKKQERRLINLRTGGFMSKKGYIYGINNRFKSCIPNTRSGGPGADFPLKAVPPSKSVPRPQSAFISRTAREARHANNPGPGDYHPKLPDNKTPVAFLVGRNEEKGEFSEKKNKTEGEAAMDRLEEGPAIKLLGLRPGFSFSIEPKWGAIHGNKSIEGPSIGVYNLKDQILSHYKRNYAYTFRRADNWKKTKKFL